MVSVARASSVPWRRGAATYSGTALLRTVASVTPLPRHLSRPHSALCTLRRAFSTESTTQQHPQPSYVALQHFGPGRQVHFSLAGSTTANGAAHASTPLLQAHRSKEDRRIEAEQREKQQLLQALFSTSSGNGVESAAGAPGAVAAVPFSPRWYPLARLLLYILPQHYPSSVNACYLTYSKWVFLGSILGTASSVLSMQCLLVSLGLGAAALPASAAINWVLKDGLGQLGGMLFASLVSTRFDMQPIRYRLLCALVLDASVLLEILTPLVPSLFLPLASLANIGKNISWLGASASRAAIHRSFLRRENLADVTAKSGSQTILASLGGTALGIGLSVVTGTDTAAILACFLVLSAGHLMATYRALSRVVLNHITEQRLDVLSHQYLQAKANSSPAAIPASHHSNLLTSPVTLQLTEPLFWFQRPDGRAGASESSEVCIPAWSASSVNYRPRFERMVARMASQPELQLSSAELTAQITPNALYHAWLAQFDGLPFVTSIYVTTDPQQSTHSPSVVQQACDFGRRLRQRMGLATESESLPASENVAEPAPLDLAHTVAAASSSSPSSSSSALHLRILVVFKSHASSSDLLAGALYVSHVRDHWQRLVDRHEPLDAATIAATVQSELHARGLALVRADSPSPSSSTSPNVLPSSDSVSAFVSALRASGYATQHHFVQDDNDTRITLQDEPHTATLQLQQRHA